MKTLIFIFVLIANGFLCETTFAQFTFGSNIASQPIWGPVGYKHVEYYYLPDFDAYYYVPKHKFIYAKDGHWKTRDKLPKRFKGYDLYNTRKVVINQQKPYWYTLDYEIRAIYASANAGSNQQSIRDSHDSKYFENKNHPEHSKWKEPKRNQRQVNLRKSMKIDQ